MSRSIKGSKGPGHEYWSRRSDFRDPGPWSKKMTHRQERREGKGDTTAYTGDRAGGNFQAPHLNTAD